MVPLVVQVDPGAHFGRGLLVAAEQMAAKEVQLVDDDRLGVGASGREDRRAATCGSLDPALAALELAVLENRDYWSELLRLANPHCPSPPFRFR